MTIEEEAEEIGIYVRNADAADPAEGQGGESITNSHNPQDTEV